MSQSKDETTFGTTELKQSKISFCQILGSLADNLILKVIWVRGWGKMAPGRARVSAPGTVREGGANLVR